jgi:hypothetical protein
VLIPCGISFYLASARPPVSLRFFSGLSQCADNARLRRAFWVAAQVTIRQPDNGFRAKYERYIARDRDNADRFGLDLS